MIYLDHNATTPPTPGAVAAARRALEAAWANPSSVHRAGQEARREIELARAALARLIHAKPAHLTLLSSGTESINLALRGVLRARRLRQPSGPLSIVTTAIEHAAIRDLAADLVSREAIEVRLAPLGPHGLLDPAAVLALVDASTAVVSVQWANNETGAIQPVGEIARRCRAAGVLMHCDATQWVGKMPADIREPAPPEGEATPGGSASAAFAAAHCPCDLLTFAPHKFGGPKGVGVLWARPGVSVAPLFPGAQERGRRAGTENVPGIAGAGAAADEALAWLTDPANPPPHPAGLARRNRLESAILASCPGAVVSGPPDQSGRLRLWNTTNIAFPRLEAEALLLAMSERGLAASAGAACSSGSLEPSPVLLAMGVPPELAHGSVRFSLGPATTDAEVDAAAGIVAEVVARARRGSPLPAGASAAPAPFPPP